MSLYTPDSWVLVEITTPSSEPMRKVFAGWYGGWAAGDSWKLSSSINEIIDFGEHYEFHNESGSIYECYKSVQRMSTYMMFIYRGWEKQQSDEIKIRILENVEITK